MVIGACLCKSSHLLLPIFHGAPHLLACEQCWDPPNAPVSMTFYLSV